MKNCSTFRPEGWHDPIVPRDKVLFFAPWVGEFGYELTNWIGQCEAIRRRYPGHFAVASSYWGRKALYKFCDKFLPHALESNYADTQANRWMGQQVKYHPLVDLYFKNSDIVVKPGDKFEGFSSELGEGFSIEHFQATLGEQCHNALRADMDRMQGAHRLANSRPVVVVANRKYEAFSAADCNWTEERWIELIDQLIIDGFFVVSLLSYMPGKPAYLIDFQRDNFLNLGVTFKDDEDFCEIQLAFLNIAKCAVIMNGGGSHLVDRSGTPFVAIYPTIWRNQNWANGGYQVVKLFGETYGCKMEFLFGQECMDVNVDTCLQAIKRVVE